MRARKLLPFRLPPHSANSAPYSTTNRYSDSVFLSIEQKYFGAAFLFLFKMATQICSDQEKPILLAQVAALEAELDCVKEMRIRAIQRNYFPAVQCLDDRIQDLLYSIARLYKNIYDTSDWDGPP